MVGVIEDDLYEPGFFSTPWSLGMGDLQPLIGNPYFMGPYKP